MARVRIRTMNDNVSTDEALEKSLGQRFKTLQITKKNSEWVLQLPERYKWTMEDADFMNSLVAQDLLANWNRMEY